MRTYLFKNPDWFRWIYRTALWKVKTSQKEIYLTFDDGPSTEVTDWVINILSEYDARGTFFCVGSQILKHPDILRKLQVKGHAIGNHTLNHVNGRKCSVNSYLQEVEDTQKLLKLYNPDKLFRPPYGKINFKQFWQLREKNYQIVMWSHLSGDFDSNLNIKNSIKSLKKAPAGSILVFHDSRKGFENLQQILPVVLEHFSTLGFQFKTLRDDPVS